MSLHFIVPVSRVDHQLLPRFCELINFHGACRGQHLTFVYTNDVPPQAIQESKASISGLFDQVDERASPIIGKGWPLGSNQLFRDCAKFAIHKRLPWMFLELDSVPLRKGWALELDAEHAKGGKRFTGCIVPTRGFMTNQAGEKIATTGDPHMVGFGIYPPDYCMTSVKLPFIDRQYNWTQAGLEPFDIQLRYEITPHAHHTDLIQHNLRTQNYRVENGQIVCDNVLASQDYAKPVDPQACILHGIKDFSLHGLILSGVCPESPHVTASSGAASPGGNGGGFLASLPAEDHGSGQPLTETLTSGVPSEIPDLAPSSSFQGASSIIKLIQDGKGRRPRDVARDLGTLENKVWEAISGPDSGLEVAKKGGWVRVKASA